MPTRQRIIVAAFLGVISLLTPTKASAYWRQTALDYNGQLFGFTTTWKDPWDEDVGGDCANWVWDPEYEEWYCESWLMWENYVETRAWLYGPGGLYASGYAEDRWQAGFDVNPFTPAGFGTWELDGNHYQKQYLYQDSGWGWEPIGANEYLLFQTAAIVTIAGPVPAALYLVSDEYTDPPPPFYNRRRTYQVVDQQGQPIRGDIPGGLYVVEQYEPATANGNCSNAPIQTGNPGYTAADGRFQDDYSLGGTPPNPCQGTSTQRYWVNGQPVSTFYVTWTYDGVTIQ